MVDGLDDRDQSVGTVKVFPNLESISQFKVQIGNYDAEFGAGGAVVNVITRSGSNEIHGSAFEFFRNASIEAVPFFAKTTPPYQLNQFGGSIGGPIRRNRAQFQDMERTAAPALLGNWRFQQALYRAYYDAYVQSRLVEETGQVEQALAVLRGVEDIGWTPEPLQIGAAPSAASPNGRDRCCCWRKRAANCNNP
jgi:hypothetical protein